MSSFQPKRKVTFTPQPSACAAPRRASPARLLAQVLTGSGCSWRQAPEHPVPLRGWAGPPWTARDGKRPARGEDGDNTGSGPSEAGGIPGDRGTSGPLPAKPPHPTHPHPSIHTLSSGRRLRTTPFTGVRGEREGRPSEEAHREAGHWSTRSELSLGPRSLPSFLQCRMPGSGERSHSSQHVLGCDPPRVPGWKF